MDVMQAQPKKNRFKPGGMAELWVLAYPVIVATISQTVMGVVDTYFMGRVGTAEQGAVGYAAFMFWAVTALFVGTSHGVSTFAAQHYGAKEYAKCGQDGWMGLYIAVPAAAILGGVAVFSFTIFELIGSEETVVPHAGQYLYIRLCGGLFVMINYGIIFFLRGIGDTKTPMYMALGANLLNILLDYALILGNWGAPRMGASGAALGSVIATAFFSLVYLGIFLSGKFHAKYQTRRIRFPSIKQVLAFTRTGVPIGGTWALEMVGWIFFMGFISRLGEVELAATIIVFEVLHFSFMVAVSLATAATTLVGQYLGAEDVGTAQKTARVTLQSGITYCVIVGLLFLSARFAIIRLFNPDPEVVAVGGRLFIYVAIFQFFDGLGISCNGVIRGAGDTRWPLVITVILTIGFFVPFTIIMTKVVGWGIDGAWVAATSFLILLGSGMYLRLRSGKWKTMRV